MKAANLDIASLDIVLGGTVSGTSARGVTGAGAGAGTSLTTVCAIATTDSLATTTSFATSVIDDIGALSAMIAVSAVAVVVTDDTTGSTNSNSLIIPFTVGFTISPTTIGFDTDMIDLLGVLGDLAVEATKAWKADSFFTLPVPIGDGMRAGTDGGVLITTVSIMALVRAGTGTGVVTEIGEGVAIPGLSGTGRGRFRGREVEVDTSHITIGRRAGRGVVISLLSPDEVA